MYNTIHTMTAAPVMTGPDSSSALVTRILETHTARILYAAPVEPIAMQRCVELIDESFSYYQYDQVEIEIESNGGRVDSMHSMRARIDRWRRDGRKIHTRALVTCASAAASLLSMGEIGGRTVSPSTTAWYIRNHEHRNDPVRFTLNRSCCHYCRDIAPESHKQRDKRTSVQPYPVHILIHDCCRPGKVLCFL